MGKQVIIPVAGGNRHIPSQPQGVELVHPVVVTGLGASRVGDSLQLWPRELIERPTLRAVLSCRSRPVERTFTLPPVEACQVSTRNDRPHDAIAINVEPTRREPMQRRSWIVPWQFVDFGQGGNRGIRARA